MTGTLRTASIVAKTHKQACWAAAKPVLDQRRTAIKGSSSRAKRKKGTDINKCWATEWTGETQKSRGTTTILQHLKHEENPKIILTDGNVQEVAQCNIFFNVTLGCRKCILKPYERRLKPNHWTTTMIYVNYNPVFFVKLFEVSSFFDSYMNLNYRQLWARVKG